MRYFCCLYVRFFRFAISEQELEKELSEVEELLEKEQLASKEQLRKHSMLVQVRLSAERVVICQLVRGWFQI
jgi:hypothetical protein